MNERYAEELQRLAHNDDRKVRSKQKRTTKSCRRLTTRRWLADYGVAYDWAAVAGCKCLIVRGKVSAFASASTLTERRTIVSILCPCLPVCPLSSKPILSPFRPLSLEVSDAERASAAAGMHRRRRLIGVRFRRQAYTKPTNEDSRRVLFSVVENVGSDWREVWSNTKRERGGVKGSEAKVVG